MRSEYGDSSENRFSKIIQIIKECKYGIHDLSRIELSKVEGNLFPVQHAFGTWSILGSKEFGNKKHQGKSCMVVDRDPWRYRGNNLGLGRSRHYCHDGKPHGAIREICKWLTSTSPRNIPAVHLSPTVRLFPEAAPVLYATSKRLAPT